MATKTNLKSSITVKGRYVSQILHFINGEKRTFNDVETKDGRLIMINDKNILCIEIITEE